MDVSELRDELARWHEDAFAWAVHCAQRDRERAADVLQASYLKVLDGRARFDGRSAFKTWLFGVIRRTAGEERRRRPWFGLIEVPSGAPAADEVMAVDERRERLVQALEQLSARQREVLVLVFYHEMTVEAAADVMGIGVGSARTHYARGKARLREIVGTWERGSVGT